MKRTVVMLVALCGVANADTLKVGLFAPSAPFPSTASRVELASKLGDYFGKAAGGTGVGHVYARAGDFAAAVKKGDVTVALVDAGYLAATGGSYTVIATTGEVGWQLVAKGSAGLKFAGLKGKRVLVPTNGGRESDFVLNVMLGGEVARDFFAKIDSAPDTASTLAALGLGKADAAVVPTGVDLPSGVVQVLALPTLPGPVLVAYGAADKRTLIGAAANGFHGDATIPSLRAGDSDAVRAISHRFSAPVKRGPLAVPAVRLLVGDLFEGRTFAIERTPIATFSATK